MKVQKSTGIEMNVSVSLRRGKFSESWYIKPKQDCIYTAPIDLSPSEFLFDVKSIEKN